MKILWRKFGLILCAVVFSAALVNAQNFKRDFDLAKGVNVEIVNNFGRVEVLAEKSEDENQTEIKSLLTAVSDKSFADAEIKVTTINGKFRVEVAPADAKKRIDLTLKIPARTSLKIQTNEGEVRVSGDFAAIEIRTETGTIAADVPLENLKYNFVWTESRPHVLSDVELAKIKEKAAGKFTISGKANKETPKSKFSQVKVFDGEETSETSEEIPPEDTEKTKNKKQKTKNKTTAVSLNLTTARGIILLNISPNEVPSDLRDRPLTNAAKAIVRSGDSLLTEAIRRAAPRYFNEYTATLPPFKREPLLSPAKINPGVNSNVKKVLVRVTDINNRAISDLKKEDFEVSERGDEREILAVVPTTAPFNLVLLLDVSGSVENYVDFIRKAARAFVETADKNDKIAIIIFNEDVKQISTFTTDKGKLSESLDTFDAGGGTAYYDSLAYTLAETLRPLRGERTAIVVLTDGDDNYSFLPFNALLGSIQESGALIYPLYVPSALIAASNADLNAKIDPLRAKYMGLTTKAEGEGEKLAQISGGVYYPITQLSQIQTAYDDIVKQLRTAYSVTFKSDLVETSDKLTASPRLKVKVKRDNAFVKLGSVVEVPTNVSEVKKKLNNSPAFLQNISYFAPYAPLREISFKKSNTGEISGDIEKVKYKQLVNDDLKTSKLENFDINQSQGAFLLNNDKETIAVSRWITPKRTRSYPYERVYDTLAADGKKITIIPVVKDEGLGGERDFLQWDTISLLSLLDVHVVLAYYDSAEKNEKRNDQITSQKLDNTYILSRLKEIFEFKGTTREWNERETKQLKPMFEKAKSSYRQISKTTKTYLHDETPLDELIKYAETPEKFIEFSRSKSQTAQNREFETLQPKEALSSDTKAKVTINNALFGKYFFTCDETKIEGKTLYLIEAKHSQRAKFPSKNDIKDGLVKMMVYTNLTNVKVGKLPFKLRVIIRLTSNQLKGSINSDAKTEDLEKYFTDNNFALKDKEFFKKLFTEAQENKFTIILEHAETAK